MDKKIDAYIEALVLEILSQPSMQNLNDLQKSEYAGKIRERFAEATFDTVLQNLSLDQLKAMENIPMDSLQMAEKIAEYCSVMPDIAQKMEDRLNKEVENIKSNPINSLL